MRVGIVGAGVMGRRRTSVLTELGDRVTAVADVDFERASALGTLVGARPTSSWRDVVEASDIDLVVVAVPNKFAAPVSIAAAEHGKHIFCEKPLGRNSTEATAIITAARRAGVTLKTGFNHRHHPALERAHELTRADSIGQPCFVRCIYGHGGRPGYEKEWRGDPDLAGGGELLDQGVHVMDLARWFLGEFVDVSAFTARWFWDIAPLEDNGFLLMRTADGKVASVHTSWTQWKNRFSFEVFGRDGYVRVEGLGGSYGLERLIVGRRRPESGPPDEQVEEFPGEDRSWQAEWGEFTSAIREGREPLGNGEDGLEALRLIEAAYEASRTGSVVKLSGIPV